MNFKIKPRNKKNNKIRGFEIVSYYKDKDINLPKRATSCSAGYDFEAAENIIIPSVFKQIFSYFEKKIISIFKGTHFDEELKIQPTLVPTGIKAYFPKDEVLYIYNRSSNPLKKGLILANSVGIIDSDYYNNPSNEGHIQFMFYNILPFDLTIKKGEKIGQGIFQKILLADNDNVNEVERNGGFGSTN